MSAVKIKCPDCGHMFSENALMCPKCGCPTARAIKANESIGCFKVCLGAAFLGVFVVFCISQADKSPSTSNASSTSVSSEQVESPVKSMNPSKEAEDMIVEEEESVTSDSAETNDVIIDVVSDENAVNSTGTPEDVVVEEESVTSNSVETDDVVKDETPKKKSFLRRMIQKHRKNKQRQN